MRRLILEIRWEVVRFFAGWHIARAKRNAEKAKEYAEAMGIVNDEIREMVNSND